jgi:hypothetical protein
MKSRECLANLSHPFFVTANCTRMDRRHPLHPLPFHLAHPSPRPYVSHPLLSLHIYPISFISPHCPALAVHFHHPSFSSIIHHPSFSSIVLIHHPSSIIHHPSPITHHPSSIIHHPLSIIHHPSSITPINYHP